LPFWAFLDRSCLVSHVAPCGFVVHMGYSFCLLRLFPLHAATSLPCYRRSAPCIHHTVADAFFWRRILSLSPFTHCGSISPCFSGPSPHISLLGERTSGAAGGWVAVLPALIHWATRVLFMSVGVRCKMVLRRRYGSRLPVPYYSRSSITTFLFFCSVFRRG